jgi:uncharacterized membrane protein YfcA
VIGSAVGAVVGGMAKLIEQWRQRNQNSVQPRRWVIYAAMLGSFLGMLLICLLPINANSMSLHIGCNEDARQWYMTMLVVLTPIGSILGAVVGAILRNRLPARIHQQKLAGFVLLVSYLICTVVLCQGLAPHPQFYPS